MENVKSQLFLQFKYPTLKTQNIIFLVVIYCPKTHFNLISTKILKHRFWCQFKCNYLLFFCYPARGWYIFSSNTKYCLCECSVFCKIVYRIRVTTVKTVLLILT